MEAKKKVGNPRRGKQSLKYSVHLRLEERNELIKKYKSLTKALKTLL